MNNELEELLRRADELLILSLQIQKTSRDIGLRGARVFESHEPVITEDGKAADGADD